MKIHAVIAFVALLQMSMGQAQKEPCEGDDCPTKRWPRLRSCHSIVECREKLKDLAECPERNATSKKSDFYDEETCCPACKPIKLMQRKPVEKLKNALKGRFCPQEKIEQCKQDVPECFDGERPSFMEAVCCGSCIRKNSKKRLMNVIKGNKLAPVKNEKGCGSGNTTCPGQKRCIRAFLKGSHKFSDNVFKCVSKKHKKVLIKARKALKDAGVVKQIMSFLKNATDGEARELIVEMVNRVCDNPDFEALCDKHQEFVVRYLVVKVTGGLYKSKAEDELSVDLELPVPVVSEDKRRRLSSGDVMDLVDAAVNDSGELEDELSLEEYAGVDTDGDADNSKAVGLTISTAAFAFIALQL